MTDPNRYRDPLSGETQSDLDAQQPFSGMPNAPKVEAQPQDQEAEDIAALHHAEAQMYDEQQEQDSSADQLAAMRRASSITPEYAAYCDKLSADLDVPFNAVAHDKEAARKEADVPAWQQIARFAPKTSALLQEKPEVFHQVQDDAAALKDLEVFKSELKKNGVTDDEYTDATKTIFDPAESIKAELNRSLETGTPYVMPSRQNSAFFTNLDALGTQFNESAIQSDIGMRSLFNDMQESLGVISPDEALANRDNLTREYKYSVLNSSEATPNFEHTLFPKTNEFVFGGASSLVQSAPAIAAGLLNPLAGVLVAGAQTTTTAYPKYSSRGGSMAESLFGAGIEGLIEMVTEKNPVGFAAEHLGKMSIKNFAKQFLGREMIGEQLATFGQDLTDTLIANPNKTMAEFWQERPEAAVQTMFAVGMNTVAMASIQHIANTVMKYDGSYEANQKLNQEMEIVKKLKVAGLNTVRAKQILDNMDGDSAPDVYIDPQQLFNQGQISQQQFKNAMPNYSTQLDEALAVGGLLRMNKNELMLAMRNDEEGWASLSQHLKVDPAADSLYESAQSIDALTDELNKLADKRIAESKDEAEARDLWDALKEKARQRLADSGMDKEAIEQAATMDASVAYAFSTRTGLDAGDILSGQFGKVSRRLSDGSVVGGVYNQTKQDELDEIDFFESAGIYSKDEAATLRAKLQKEGDRDESRYDENGYRITARDEAGAYLSHFPATTEIHGEESAGVRRIRQSSDRITNELGGKAGESREVGKRLGAFSSYVVEAQTYNHPTDPKQGLLEIRYYGKEQKDAGLTGEPALTVTVSKDGEFGINGPSPESETFKAFKERGWAEEAKQKDGVINKEHTRLINPHRDDGQFSPSQVKDILADAHARLRAWRKEDRVGLNWGRATGATGGEFGNEGAAFFQSEKAKPFDGKESEEYFQEKDSPRGFFDPSTRDITLLPTSDLSTYLHESGHLYLEVMASLAAHETASEGLRADMDAALKWFGVKGENASERLAAWNAMTLEEKRNFHEKWAESFEQYLFEGVAPSPELREAFKNFRQWLTHVYKSMAQFLVGQKNAKLNDEMRGVFDRMLASEEQINTMREARNMLPLFTVRQANMTDDEWERYQKDSKDFVEKSIEQLTSRSLRDMKWLSNAKNKTLRKLQREAAQARREARMEAMTAVLGQPVYRAWQFLTAPVEGGKEASKKARSNPDVDPSRDSLLVAIAKLGGLNKEQAVSQYGIDPADFKSRKGLPFGKSVLSKDGLSPDAMAEALSQHNYLPLDEHGKWDILDLEDLLLEEAAGNPQYSTDVDMDVLLGEPQRAFFDTENVEYMGGRLNRIDIRNMFDDIDLANMAGVDPFAGEKVADSAVLQGYNQKRRVEGSGNERQYVLFEETGNGNAADKKRAGSKGASRNMESAERVPGRYTTTVKSEKTKEINAGFDLLDTPAKVAFATSSLSKSPQEVLFAVATDKNNKPIAILRHSIGMRNSARVDPGIVAGWAANVEGAANLWLSHNHPSGKSDLSKADRNISKIIGDILDGTGITHRGIIAVTHEGNYSWADTSGSDEAGRIPEPEKNKKVSVVEREFSSNGLLSDDYSDGVNNPTEAIEMAKDIGGGDAGIVMLDAQYRPIGFMPINYTEANNARGTKLHKDIVRAVELSNANAVLHYSPDRGRAVEYGMLNIGALMNMANIQTIDAIVGGNTSLASRDSILYSDTFQQNKKQKNKDPNAPRTLESMGVLSDDGIQPDLLADYFGFPSVEAMVKSLLTAPDPLSEINRLTDEIMVQRHADLATPQAIEQAALAALHSEAHLKFLATELAILNRAVGKPRLVMQAAKQYADRIVSALRIADLNPAQYEMQAAKAGKETEKLLGQNKAADAAMAKRNQILHDATARRVREERENVAKALRFFDRTEKAARNGKLRADVGAQVLTLLDSYDLRKGTTLKAAELADRSLAEFVQQQSESMDMPMPSLADAVLRGGVKRSYKTMGVEEFNGLVDAVKYLEAVGRREYAMYKAVRDQSFAQERSAILDRLREYWPDAFDEEGNPLPTENAILKTGAYNAKKKARSVAHELLTPETVTNILEGGVFGQVHESLFARLSNALTDRSILMKELHEKLQQVMDAYTWKERREFGKKDIGTAAIGEPLSRENALVAALLAGSKEGRDRLANYGWNDARIAQVVNLLDAKDIALANAIFDMFDNTLWPKLEALNKRTIGVSPPKVLPIALQAKNGTLTGGYFPIRYDGDMDARSSSFDDKQALDLMKNGIGLSAKTNQSSSQARVDGVKMRPLLSLSVMSKVASETAHDIALREAVMDSARLLNNAEIAQGIQNIVGMEGWKSLKKNLGDIASPPHDAGGIFAGAANFARRNVVTSLMSGVGTAVQNFTGLFPAFARVHKGLLLKEIADVPHWIEKYKDTIEKSAYMRERFGQFERDLVNDVDKLSMKKGLMPDQSVWFAMMAWIDRAVSVPVWQAAYREGAAKGVDAVEYADHIVRQTQGGGRLIDRAPIMRGGALQQLFTMFYSYFNGQLNMVARDAALAKREVAQGEVSKAAARLAASAIFVWILPAVVSELTRQAPDDEDDEEKLQRVVRATILYPTAMIPLLRDFAPFVYDKIAGNRAFDPRLTPVQGFVSTLSRAATAAGDIGSDDFDEKDFKALMMGVGFTFNLPAILFTDVVLGTKALLNGETDDIRAPLIGTAPSR